MVSSESLYYMDSSFVINAIEESGLDINDLHCSVCDHRIKPEEVGGFINGSVDVICKDPECKMVARIKEFTYDK